jgi:hypothetical protein
MAALCVHSYGQQASYQSTVTLKLYDVVSRGIAIHAIRAVEAVRKLEAMFCRIVGPSVVCGHGCVPIAVISSC